MTDFDIELGKVLRNYRLKLKMNQTDVATKLHVTKMTVSHWENGKRSMTAENLKRYCDVLDVPVQTVFDRM